MITKENLNPVFVGESSVAWHLDGTTPPDHDTGAPLLKIDLVTGQLYLSPAGRDIFKENGRVNYWKASCEGVRQFYCETRMGKSRTFFGTWSANPASDLETQ